MLVTIELIESGCSGAGGWNQHQLKLIGVDWPPMKGWKNRAVGMEISEEDAALFVSIKGMKRGKRKQILGPVPKDGDAISREFRQLVAGF